MQRNPEDTIEFRLKILEQRVDQYVTIRESELQLQRMHDAVSRIEQDTKQMTQQFERLSQDLTRIEADSLRRDTVQQESLSALQIRLLWAAIGPVITILTIVLAGYLTHLIH